MAGFLTNMRSTRLTSATDGDPSLNRALAQALHAHDAIPDAIEQLRVEPGIPLVEPGAATFLWFGEADRVELLRWINAGVDAEPFKRLPGTDLWQLRLVVEDGGRFEYKLRVTADGEERWLLDPLNPNTACDPFGENSVCRTFGYERPGWSRPRGAPPGRIIALDIESEAFGERRHESLYVPHHHEPDHACPILIVHDGDDYVTYADLSVSLDNLIEAGDLPPMLVVLVQTSDRTGEYPKGRRHARYLVHELLPEVARRYRISDASRDRVLMGASLGAVASLATAFRYPGVFGGLVLKSGSFILDESKLGERGDPAFARIAQSVRLFRRAPRLQGVRAFVSTGELEGLAEENRNLADLLRERGVDVRFQSAWDGHHWHNWRDQLRDGLMWVLRSDA